MNIDCYFHILNLLQIKDKMNLSLTCYDLFYTFKDKIKKEYLMRKYFDLWKCKNYENKLFKFNSVIKYSGYRVTRSNKDDFSEIYDKIINGDKNLIKYANKLSRYINYTPLYRNPEGNIIIYKEGDILCNIYIEADNLEFIKIYCHYEIFMLKIFNNESITMKINIPKAIILDKLNFTNVYIKFNKNANIKRLYSGILMLHKDYSNLLYKKYK